eukprot:1798724-Alexandrium_andersonii.AAC.1
MGEGVQGQEQCYRGHGFPKLRTAAASDFGQSPLLKGEEGDVQVMSRSASILTGQANRLGNLANVVRMSRAAAAT